MLNSILPNMLAGLGLFFSGLRLVDANLRQATGRRLRMAVGRITSNTILASLVGLLTGALVQSTSGIVFILVSLVAGGLTTVPRVLPIVAWANVGCGALIFAAVLDLKIAILYLLGLAGAAYAFDKSHRNHALGAVFGVGMLFFGIEIMKTGAEPLKDLPWFAVLLNNSHNSLIIAFLGGTGFSFVTQSSTAVSILAIGLAQTGLFGPYATMMALYGANVGSTFSRMLLSTGLRGSTRQVAAFQDLFKISGAVLFVSMLYLEAFAGIPLVWALTRQISYRIDHQMALVFLFFNLATAILFSALMPWISRLLAWRYPPDESEDLSKTKFIYPEAIGEPVTALDLLDKEQIRLAHCLRFYADGIRGAAGSAQRARADAVQRPFEALVQHIEQFQGELVDSQLGPEETERLTKLQNRLNLIVYMEDSLRGLMVSTDAVTGGSRLAELVSTFVEALDFVLMTTIQALETGDREKIDLLLDITEDRGELMEQIRQNFLEETPGVESGDRAILLYVTSIFERVIWMTQRLARLMVRDVRPAVGDAAPTSNAVLDRQGALAQ